LVLRDSVLIGSGSDLRAPRSLTYCVFEGNMPSVLLHLQLYNTLVISF